MWLNYQFPLIQAPHWHRFRLHPHYQVREITLPATLQLSLRVHFEMEVNMVLLEEPRTDVLSLIDFLASNTPLELSSTPTSILGTVGTVHPADSGVMETIVFRPSDPSAPSCPSAPAGPCAPSCPSVPSCPSAPSAPAGPCAPSCPSAPADPGGPEVPVNHLDRQHLLVLGALEVPSTILPISTVITIRSVCSVNTCWPLGVLEVPVHHLVRQHHLDHLFRLFRQHLLVLGVLHLCTPLQWSSQLQLHSG